MFRILVALASCLVASGCATAAVLGVTGVIFSEGWDSPQNYNMRSTFSARQAAHILQYQSTVVQGRVWVKTPGNLTIVGKRSRVQLIPVTAYSTEYIDAMFDGKRTSILNVSVVNLDPNFFKYVRHEVADLDGLFAFSGVPDGDYFVLSSLKWNQRVSTSDPGHARVYAIVNVRGKDRYNVVLNGL